MLHAIFGGCASAPEHKAPAELIVGAWDCAMPGMAPGGHYRLTFGDAGSLLLDFDGGTDDLVGAKLTMLATGQYETAREALLVEIEGVDIKSAVVGVNGDGGSVVRAGC